MNEKQIVNIAIDHIFPHPDNPRKNLGDLTEIAESIRKRGIMQNLTVVIIMSCRGVTIWLQQM